MAQTFHIVLKSVGGQEALDAREIDLPIGSSCPIGRSSKNSTKPELLPALGNAFIDSPVISRDHAKLTADTSSGSPQVYIQDVGSMHGTMVNGERLARKTPKQLASGDLLQFGVDVNRDKEYYVARKYTFERTLMPEKVAAYSYGFTVPDSDEEDNSLSLRRGSQDNPLTIDESDGEPEESEPKVNMLTQERSNHHELNTSTEAQLRYSQIEELYGEDSDYPPSYDCESGLDADSVAHETDSEGHESLSVVHDSDNQSDLELPSDIESEAEDEIVSSMRDLADEDLTVNVPIVRDDEDFSSLPGHDSINPMSPVDVVPQVASILPPMPPMLAMDETLDPDVFSASRPPPLPPRPSATVPSFMNYMPVPPSVRQNEQPAWYSDQMPFAPNFIGTNYGDRPALFSPAPVSSAAQVHNHHFSFAQSIDPPSIISTVQRIPTPPPVAPSDDTSLVTPPSRRTKVSITEIVEERPPTPASLNKLKRKADLTDDEETPAAKRSTSPAVQVAVQDEPLDQTTSEAATEIVNENIGEKQDAEQAAIIAQRPKKQPRSIISKLKNTATFLGYGALGAVGAVAVLSNLPDTFFT